MTSKNGSGLWNIALEMTGAKYLIYPKHEHTNCMLKSLCLTDTDVTVERVFDYDRKLFHEFKEKFDV